MNSTPTTAAGNDERARLITPEDQPVFPCWLYVPAVPEIGEYDAEWVHHITPIKVNIATHWHPDQPTAPTCTPQAALSPGNAEAAGETDKWSETRAEYGALKERVASECSAFASVVSPAGGNDALRQRIAEAVCAYIDKQELDEVMNVHAVEGLKNVLNFIITKEIK